jgi:hypothetical protein
MWHGRLAREHAQDARADLLFDRLEQSTNLFTQFRVVCVTVTGNGVIDSRIEDFFFGAFDAERTAALAGIVPAINGFSF